MSGVWERVESVAAFPLLSLFVLSSPTYSLPLPVNRNGCNYACQILFEVLFIVSTYKKGRKCR